MDVIYEPAGRAAEYAALAINLYTGCNHGCLFCYNRCTPWYDAVRFNNPEPRKNILENIEKSAKKHHGEKREILLCFSCDPYPAAPLFLARPALEILAYNGLRACILTKGGRRAVRDFDILSGLGFRFGTSLSWANDKSRAEWEPNAAPVADRIDAMMIAKAKDIRTFLSIEPVIDPEQALKLIELLLPMQCVDEWRIGRWNHDARANSIDWITFYRCAKNLLDGKDVIWKRDLLLAAGVPAP
jgi:DNA repair photolyase